MSTAIHPKWSCQDMPRTHKNAKADILAADAIVPPPVPDGDPLAGLGVVQQRVARLIGYGMTNAQIAAVMGISVRTTKIHANSIYKSLRIGGVTGVSSRRLAFLIGYWEATRWSSPAEVAAVRGGGEEGEA